MKPFLAVGCFALILGLAAPANAEVSSANAARDAVASGSEDVDTDEAFASCGVRLLVWGDDPFAILSCIGDEGVGEAWVRVRVPEVRGRVTRVSAAKTEDCSPSDLTWRKRRSVVRVTISVTANADCQIRTVRVRYERRQRRGSRSRA
jgi:hypothetical protein